MFGRGKPKIGDVEHKHWMVEVVMANGQTSKQSSGDVSKQEAIREAVEDAAQYASRGGANPPVRIASVQRCEHVVVSVEKVSGHYQTEVEWRLKQSGFSRKQSVIALLVMAIVLLIVLAWGMVESPALQL